jgi:hypothetical protein
MTVMLDTAGLARAAQPLTLGSQAIKSTGTLAATTIPLFTIAGGAVAISSMVGRVTTAITVANSYKLQHNPTLGTTFDLCAAADLGTVDTILGEILIVVGPRATPIAIGNQPMTSSKIICDTGQIESVSAGTDGVILWLVTWAPIDVGATLVAA